jgi:hypothetical protein
MQKQHDFEHAANWYTYLAQQPGWIDHCRHAVQELEQDESGIYKGLRLAVRERIENHRAALAAQRAQPERTGPLVETGQRKEGVQSGVRVAGKGARSGKSTS